MAILNWTEPALQNLKDICAYIAADSPSAASRLGQQVFNKSKLLKLFPNMGQVWQERENSPIRALHYGSYRILYNVTEDKTVNILGVFHAAMHPDNYDL